MLILNPVHPFRGTSALPDNELYPSGHDPKTMQLRATRPGFLIGIANLAKSSDPVPHLPSIERWRKGDRKRDYDANIDASRQEMRSMACGQCHVEYYFKPDNKQVTYP